MKGIYAYKAGRRPRSMPPTRAVVCYPHPCLEPGHPCPLRWLQDHAPSLAGCPKENSQADNIQLKTLNRIRFPLIINENPSFGLEDGEVAMFHRARRVVKDVHLNCIPLVQSRRLAYDVHECFHVLP